MENKNRNPLIKNNNLFIKIPILLTGISLSFIILNLFIPFMYLSRVEKIIFILAFIISSIILYLFFLRYIKTLIKKDFFRTLEESRKSAVFILIFATFLTILFLTLIKHYSPLVPKAEIDKSNFAELAFLKAIYLLWPVIYQIARIYLFFVFSFLSIIFIANHSESISERVLFFGLLFFLTFFYLTSLNFQNEVINPLTHNFLIASIAIFIFIFIPIKIIQLLKKHPEKETFIVILIFLILISLQIIFVNVIPNTQVSDFLGFEIKSNRLALEDKGTYIGLYATFIRLLALFHKVFPSTIAVKYLNIFFIFLSMTGLYLIGRGLGNSRVGIIAAYLFGLLPFQSGMVTIVNNDIPSITFLIFCALFLIRFLNNEKFFDLLFCAFLMGIAIQIRSSLIIYSPILLTAFFFNYQKSIKGNIEKVISIVGGITLSLIIINVIFSIFFVEAPNFNENKNIIYTLLNGTNITFEGKHNFEDQRLINNWPSDEIVQRGLRTVISRIISDPGKYYTFLKVKYGHLFGDSTYAAEYIFNFNVEDQLIIKKTWIFSPEESFKIFARFSQYSYWCLLGASCLFIFYYNSTVRKFAWISLIIFISAFIFYIFFEVQPRYSLPHIPFLIIFASYFYNLRNTN